MITNQLILIGRMGSDPVKKTTKSDMSIVNVNIATNYYVKGKDGYEQRTRWVPVTFFDKTAEYILKNGYRGAQAIVTATVEQKKYEKDGETKYSMSIVGNGIQIPSLKSNTTKETESDSAQYDSFQAEESSFQDEDIPF